MAGVLQFYQSPALSAAQEASLVAKTNAITKSVKSVITEFCYYVDCQGKLLGGNAGGQFYIII